MGSLMAGKSPKNSSKEASNKPSLDVEATWATGLRTAAWEEFWRRILTDVINGLTEATDNCVLEGKTDENP
jgi:hypothetical protein